MGNQASVTNTGITQSTDSGFDSLSLSVHPNIPKEEITKCEAAAAQFYSLILGEREEIHPVYEDVREKVKRIKSLINDICRLPEYRSHFTVRDKKDSHDVPGELKKIVIGFTNVLEDVFDLANSHMSLFGFGVGEDNIPLTIKADDSMKALVTVLDPTNSKGLYSPRYYLIRDECSVLLTHVYEQFLLFRKFMNSIKTHEDKINEQINKTTDANEALKLMSKKLFNVSSYFLNDSVAQIFWTRYFGERSFSVEKKLFLEKFKSHLKELHDRNSKKKLSFKKEEDAESASPIPSPRDIVWCDEFELLVDPTCDGYVSVNDFKSFLGWFGPMDKCCVNAESLINAPWFYGSMTSFDAQVLLDQQELGTYVVRFNENKPGSFYISCTEEKLDENGANTLNQQNTLQTVRYTVNKTDKHAFYLYVREEMDTIEALLQQYDLTFSQGYVDQDIKYKSIMENRIPGEEKDSQLFEFLRQPTFTGLNRELRLSDLNFATFRGRVPDMPHMKKSKQSNLSKARSNSERKKLSARKSGVPAEMSEQISLVDKLKSSATEMIEMVEMQTPRNTIQQPAVSTPTSDTSNQVTSPSEESTSVHVPLLEDK